MRWTILKIDKTGNILQTIDTSRNPSALTSELYLPENSLTRATYRFVFTITINATKSIGSIEIANSIDTYYEIISPDIIVFGLENGITQIRIGSLQDLSFNPDKYSYLIGSDVLPSDLEYKFYCRVVDYLSNTTLFSNNSDIDLLTYKTNSIPMNENVTCFNSKSNLI